MVYLMLLNFMVAAPIMPIGGIVMAVREDAQARATAASSLEFIQECALIHDDIIDASDTRRGNPTVHRAVAACPRPMRVQDLRPGWLLIDRRSRHRRGSPLPCVVQRRRYAQWDFLAGYQRHR